MRPWGRGVGRTNCSALHPLNIEEFEAHKTVIDAPHATPAQANIRSVSKIDQEEVVVSLW